MFEWLHKKYENTKPLVNPITYQFNENFKTSILGDAGKIYLKRGRMNDGIFYQYNDINYAVPGVWNCPFGFIHDGHSCWITKSEAVALRHFREYKNAQNHLKKKWENIIKEQDYIYSLSKAIDCNIELPIVKETFVVRSHQKLGIEFGNLTNGRFIIADQQRTGKSFTALLYVLSQVWDICLIVCPAKVVSVWINMIKSICDENINLLRSEDSLKNGFNIVSYDLLHTIDDLDCDIAIADEAHFFIKDEARRSRAVNRINAEKKLALTGTPIMNDVKDIISILEWVNPFLAIEMGDLILALKDEKPYEQSRIIGQELKRRCLLLRETRQVSESSEPYINFIALDANLENPKNLQEVGRAKINYAVEYCNSFQDQILVVFYYKQTGKILKARLGNKAALIDGDSSKQEIETAIEAFRNGEIQYFLASTVISEGLDFSFCNNILMVEESSYSMRTDQIRERCNKVNKREEVTIDILTVPETQDSRVYELLGNKFALQEGLRDS